MEVPPCFLCHLMADCFFLNCHSLLSKHHVNLSLLDYVDNGSLESMNIVFYWYGDSPHVFLCHQMADCSVLNCHSLQSKCHVKLSFLFAMLRTTRMTVCQFWAQQAILTANKINIRQPTNTHNTISSRGNFESLGTPKHRSYTTIFQITHTIQHASSAQSKQHLHSTSSINIFGTDHPKVAWDSVNCWEKVPTTTV